MKHLVFTIFVLGALAAGCCNRPKDADCCKEKEAACCETGKTADCCKAEAAECGHPKGGCCKAEKKGDCKSGKKADCCKEKAPCCNPVIETIMARRSVRHYTDQAVPREILQKIAECGVNAPNAMNRQNWEVRIIDNAEYFDGITKVIQEGGPFKDEAKDPKFRNAFRNATAAIAVACPDDESGMSLINVGLLGENVCLAAKSFGLGSVVMAGPVMMMNTIPAAKPYLDKLGFSDGYKLRIIIGLGYPDEEPETRPRDLGKIKFVD